jgi:antitoxin ParD1/3/4
MSRNTSVVLGDHFLKLIEDQVASGRYASASEVVRAGLRLLEEREARLEELRAEIRKGEESGWIEDADIDALFRDIIAGTAA